jgi:hypothetical protein
MLVFLLLTSFFFSYSHSFSFDFGSRSKKGEMFETGVFFELFPADTELFIPTEQNKEYFQHNTHFVGIRQKNPTDPIVDSSSIKYIQEKYYNTIRSWFVIGSPKFIEEIIKINPDVIHGITYIQDRKYQFSQYPLPTLIFPEDNYVQMDPNIVDTCCFYFNGKCISTYDFYGDAIKSSNMKEKVLLKEKIDFRSFMIAKFIDRDLIIDRWAN